MKKIVCLILALAMVLSLCGCGQSAKEPAIDPADYSNTAASMNLLFSKIVPKSSGVEVVKSNNEYSVYYNSTSSFYDDTDIIKTILSDYINFCRIAYSVEGVKSVAFYAKVTMTDARGKTDYFDAMFIEMSQETFSSYNWDNMKFVRGSIAQIEDDCTVFWIYPSIRNNADLQKVFYKG